MAEYRWAEGSHINRVDILSAKSEIERLQREYTLVQPEHVVEAARPDDAPLHNAFTWDDTEAAQKWRLSEAGHVLRCVARIEIAEDGEEIRTREYWPVSVTIEGQKTEHGFVSYDVAMANPSFRSQVLERALSEYRALGRKYKNIAELSKVRDAVEAVAETAQEPALV